MKSAIDLLKQSIKSTQDAAVKVQEEVNEAKGVLRNKENALAALVDRVEELEAGLKMIEKKVKK